MDIDEDSIDTEALQAQIDMSMAFAQNLVSSWVKPSRKVPAKSNRDVEAELQEYMRRPPRLGVGAAIPESQSLSRETARLKGQLVGKSSKRAREEDDVVTREKSDNEEESRAGAIRKKAKVDPFGEGKKKKKSKKLAEGDTAVTHTPHPLVVSHSIPTGVEKPDQMPVEKNGRDKNILSTPLTPRKKKHKQKLLGEDCTESAQAPNGVMTTEGHEAEKLTEVSPQGSKVMDISLIKTPLISSRFQHSSELADVLKKPLLNLTSRSDSESDEPSKVESPMHNKIPKKKRKRKKKKKGQATVNV